MAPTLRGHVMGGVPGGSMREATIIAGASARLAFGSSTNWPVCWPGCRGRGAGGRGAGYSGAVQPRRAAQARALWGVVLAGEPPAQEVPPMFMQQTLRMRFGVPTLTPLGHVQ
jgi:hypothetical protein